MVPPSTSSKKKLHWFEMPDDLHWSNHKRNQHGHMRHAPLNKPLDHLDQPQLTIHENGSTKEKHNNSYKHTKRTTQVEANCLRGTTETKPPAAAGSKGSSNKASTPTAPPKQEKYREPKLSITLTREEIEEDFYGMTEKRLPRKIMKRDKSVQRDLDDIFPGFSLEGKTAESLLKKYT